MTRKFYYFVAEKEQAGNEETMDREYPARGD